MADYPYMPLWTDAYLSDTRELTPEEHGVYLLLLMCAWRAPSCELPKDDGKIARMAGLSLRRWRTLKPTILSFWTETETGYSQKRLSSERAKSNRTAQLRREAGSKGGRAKANGVAGLQAGLEQTPLQNRTIQNHNQNQRGKEPPPSEEVGGPDRTKATEFMPDGTHPALPNFREYAHGVRPVWKTATLDKAWGTFRERHEAKRDTEPGYPDSCPECGQFHGHHYTCSHYEEPA